SGGWEKQINYKSSYIPIDDTYHKVVYNSSLTLDLWANVKRNFCVFVCFGLSEIRYRPLRIVAENSIEEILVEKPKPFGYISHYLPYAYYRRFFPNTAIHHTFPRFTAQGTFENFTGLPYECYIEDNLYYCENTYYERYSCVDKDTGQDIECGCTAEGCYALDLYWVLNHSRKDIDPSAIGISPGSNPLDKYVKYIEIEDPYYKKKYVLSTRYMPTLKFNEDWKAKPSFNMTYLEVVPWSPKNENEEKEKWVPPEDTHEHFSFASRALIVDGMKVLALPRQIIQINDEIYPKDDEDLKIMGCFEGYNGPDAVVVCPTGSQVSGIIVRGEITLDNGFEIESMEYGVINLTSVGPETLRGSISASSFCDKIFNDETYFNISFVRYPFATMNDSAYFASVAFVIDVDGDNAFGRCMIAETGEPGYEGWGIKVRSYGLPKISQGYVTSAVQYISFAPMNDFRYSGDEKDDVSHAKHACGNVVVEDRTIAYDLYRRVKGCYSGTVVEENKIIGPDYTQTLNSTFNYSYGFWRHVPNTEQTLKDLLMSGVQPILFIDQEIWNNDSETVDIYNGTASVMFLGEVPVETSLNVGKLDYLTKLLREIDSFILVDAAIPFPFIQYTDVPIGSVIVVTPDTDKREYVKEVCQTCMPVIPIDFTVTSSSASFSGYAPIAGKYCNRGTLANYDCPVPASSFIDCSKEKWWDQDILFFTTKFTNIDSEYTANLAVDKMIEALNKSITYSGKPAYLYIYEVTPIKGIHYLMKVMANRSDELSAVGVMGVHFEDFDQALVQPGSAIYEGNELGRGLRAATIKSVEEVIIDDPSLCKYVVSEEDVVITCINNTYPTYRLAGSNPLEIENVVVNSKNFLQNSLKVALANMLSGEYICNMVPDPETGEPIYYTFFPAITYLKGTMPVLYHEIYGLDKSFGVQPYTYSDLNARQCAPQDCRFEVKTVCEPTTCYEVKEYYHVPGTTTISDYTGYIFEEGLGTDWCKSNYNNLEITGYGSFKYGTDRPIYLSKHYEDGCDFERKYFSFNYGNYTYVTTLSSNCGVLVNKTLVANITITSITEPYTLELPEIICKQLSPGWPSSACECYMTTKTVSSEDGSAQIRDDYCKYKGDTVYAIDRTRTLTFPEKVTTYIKFNETYEGIYCYDQVYLDCS
ncbi:MAG: hypothetical protein GXN92_02830, partial [Candidatus Micrarchaeota archaeon]|nr:hypothetical protein [Candidatus Micrarchaeota archaeon]